MARKSVRPLSKKEISRFCSAEAEKRFSALCHREFIIERNVSSEEFSRYGVWEWIEFQSLSRGVQYAQDFVASIVYDFYANLNYADLCQRRVWVRGQYFNFSSSIINNFLGTDDSETGYELDKATLIETLTAGSVTEWDDSAEYPLRQSWLSSEFTALLAICKLFWYPTRSGHGVSVESAQLLCRIAGNFKVNFGRIIYHEIIRWADLSKIKGNKHLPYPCLIFSILQSQHDVVDDGDIFVHPGPQLTWAPAWETGAHSQIIYKPLRGQLPLLAKLGFPPSAAPPPSPPVPAPAPASASASKPKKSFGKSSGKPSAGKSASPRKASAGTSGSPGKASAGNPKPLVPDALKRRISAHLHRQIRDFDAQIRYFERQKQSCEDLLREL